MSLKNQIAFGKNIILQKKCDQACVKFKQAFRQSRRRINALEEDCVNSLYHLLLDAKEKQSNATTARSVERKEQENSVRRAKTAVHHGYRPASTRISDEQEDSKVPPKRPSTAALKDYRISYSFVKDGMDISRIRRHDKNHTKKQSDGVPGRGFVKNETNLTTNNGTTSKTIEININDTETEQALQTKSEESDSEEIETRNDSSLNTTSMLNRPQIRNSLKSATAVTLCENKDDSPIHEQTETLRTNVTNLSGVDILSNPHVRPATVIGHTTGLKFSENNGQHKSRAVFEVTTVDDDDNDNEVSDNENVTSMLGYGLEVPGIDEEMPGIVNPESNENLIQSSNSQSEYGKPTRCSSSIARINTRPKSRASPRPCSRKRVSKAGIERPGSENILQQSAEKTQNFLKDYAKKSKLFSYVVNANSSIVAPRDRKIYRSPKVTFQELVSIKAEVKKQLMQTRAIVQKSARLSSYVQKLTGQSTLRAQRIEQLQ